MTQEDRVAHDEFSAAILKDLAPAGALETQLAQRIATDSWRLNRISAIEDNIFALGFQEHADKIDTEHPEIHAALTAAKTFQSQAKQLQLLSLYEQRLNRSLQKNLDTLRRLQAERKAERRRALEEAKKLYQVRQNKDLPTDLGSNGFVFSSEEIRSAIDRDRRLHHADYLDSRHHKQDKLHRRTHGVGATVLPAHVA